jgi:hypothetical protein
MGQTLVAYLPSHARGVFVIISAEDDEVSIHDRVYKGYVDKFDPFGCETRSTQDLLNDIKENLIVFPSLGMDAVLLIKSPASSVKQQTMGIS